MKLNYINTRFIIISTILTILIIFISLQSIIYYNSSNVSRLKEKFYTVIEPGSKDITVLQKNMKGETNVYRPNIYYKFIDENKNNFDIDNYFCR